MTFASLFPGWLAVGARPTDRLTRDGRSRQTLALERIHQQIVAQSRPRIPSASE